jgi:protein gp37
MSANSKIAWCDDSQNWWVGCTRISRACDLCYAAAWAGRFEIVEWDGKPKRTSAALWRQPYSWDKAAAKAGVRRRIFTLSLGDFFDNQADPAWRAEAWEIIARCRNLDWLVLTKRPQNIAKMLPPVWPLPHVWLGVTAENQEEADRRLPILLQIPAAQHFASCEPLFEPVDLRRHLGRGLSWVIAGGESGVGCRPFDTAWARGLRDQCAETGTAFFMKQLGGARNARNKLDDLPPDLRVREWPR